MTALEIKHGHLLAEINGQGWVIDTGSPMTFGAEPLQMNGVQHSVPNALFGLDAESLSENIGVEVAGLIGADKLNQFDHLFDLPGGQWTMSETELNCDGVTLTLASVQGVPLLEIQAFGAPHRVFLDTGAQLSYLNHPELARGEPTGEFLDFHPLAGQFQVQTYRTALTVGGQVLTCRCGELPPMLAGQLAGAGASGILGVDLIRDRISGYFPRRNQWVMGKLE